jgi:hypothetical protein
VGDYTVQCQLFSVRELYSDSYRFTDVYFGDRVDVATFLRDVSYPCIVAPTNAFPDSVKASIGSLSVSSFAHVRSSKLTEMRRKSRAKAEKEVDGGRHQQFPHNVCRKDDASSSSFHKSAKSPLDLNIFSDRVGHMFPSTYQRSRRLLR